MQFNFFKDLFNHFIKSRGIKRYFRHLAPFDLQQRDDSKNISNLLKQSLLDASAYEPDELLKRLGSHVEGLTDREARTIQERVGLNELGQEKPPAWWKHLWHCYKNPFNLLLTLLAVISYYTEDTKAAIVISTMVSLSTLIRFVQETRSNRAVDQLKEMVSNTATISRRDKAQAVADEALKYFQANLHPKPPKYIDIPIKLLVPGDVVILSAGDMIPADLRILIAKDLFVSQAAMTGESLPVEKFPATTKPKTTHPLELDNLLFMGTNVVSGSATAVVINTGNRTYLGALAERVSAADPNPTAFQRGVNQVSWLLIRFMLVMVPLVLLLNGFTKGDWLQAFLFALSIAVGLTPEMLPMIVTSTLAKGAVIISRKKVIIKRLDAIQNFGAMDILCTDKTGTLTQDKIFLERHTDIYGDTSDKVLAYAYLNSHYQTGLKNLLDIAVLENVALHTHLNIADNFQKVDEIPFDFQRRRMSVVVAERGDHHLLICKGAVEEMLSIATHVQHGEHIEAMSPAVLARIQATTAALNEEGLRVVAVASKETPLTQHSYSVADESDLTLIGYIAFLDPPKESTAPALQALAEHGITVKILTGDNERVTSKICHQVGLTIKGILLGSTIETMSDEQLTQAAEQANVFAKLSPNHKERIVRILRNHGHVVGFMGDGINDAPALRTADIGISVDSAVDIAKESADIILLEKSLMVLEEGVIEGRKTFSNMLKYIKMTASSNFGNVFSVLIASVFLPFLPMLPLHLLVQNLLYDISQAALPFDHVDPEALKLPQHWNSHEIGRFMLFFGPMSSLFDITTFALMWFVFQANSLANQTLFQSGWFLEGLLSQTLIVHMIRTQKIPFLQSRASWPLILMTLTIMALGVFLIMGPWAHYFKLQALPAIYFVYLAGILMLYLLITQLMKYFYAKRYGWY